MKQAVMKEEKREKPKSLVCVCWYMQAEMLLDSGFNLVDQVATLVIVSLFLPVEPCAPTKLTAEEDMAMATCATELLQYSLHRTAFAFNYATQKSDQTYSSCPVPYKEYL